jgi:hypothetical protein
MDERVEFIPQPQPEGKKQKRNLFFSFLKSQTFVFCMFFIQKWEASLNSAKTPSI